MKNPNPKIPNRALSVRQPLAEQIMRGTKKIEYRNIHTNIRGRVYIYASKAPATWAYEKMKTNRRFPGWGDCWHCRDYKVRGKAR